jgi:mono/diheme cytochrome c family protein
MAGILPAHASQRLHEDVPMNLPGYDRMQSFRKFFLLVILLTWCVFAPTYRATLATDNATATFVKQLIKTHCVKCHGSNKQEGDIRLDDLSTDEGQDVSRWSLVHEQLRGELMPPEGEPKITREKLGPVLDWLSTKSSQRRLPLPNQGNLIAHELLFGKPATEGGASPARVWRLSPEGYKGFVVDVHRGRADGVVQPFTVTPERGIKDFAELYSIDEPSTEVLLRNAEIIVTGQTAHEIKDGKLHGKGDTIGEFVKLMDPSLVPSRSQLESAVQTQFRMAIGRKADASEVERFISLYEKCAQDGDQPAAVKTMLQAVLLRADAMYRAELGAASNSSSKTLQPLEVARAVSLALGDRRESGIQQAAEKGQLITKEDIAQHVQRILDDPKIKKPRLLRFFQEYFEYHHAPVVFKDRPTDKIKHVPHAFVSDTDRLVLHILEQDKNVLRELLTTPLSFVNYGTKVDKSKPDRPLVGVPFDVIPPPDKNPKNKPEWLAGVDTVYGFQEWPREQPTKLPEGQRLGILMQPSWLVAWSTNFDNDVVRRGRWIRERLLGGTVPDLPIGVVAQVPDDNHRTYRERLQVTRDAKCWKCHQYMDDLGLPFENFDHYGRFRMTEKVLDPKATEKHVDNKGKTLGPVTREAPLDTSGAIANSGDVRLNGTVSDPRELVIRLAGSDRVRQVFVRHVFRYYLGRNETLADARTLQQADHAYVTSGGSFKALLVSLLTSDSFLLRTAPTPLELQSTTLGAPK